MDLPTRTTTIQITLLNDGAPAVLRGRIRLASGATLPFVGARELVVQLRALLASASQRPPQVIEAGEKSAPATAVSHVEIETH